MTWIDITSYSRGERGKVEPSSWEIKSGNLRIVVTRWLSDKENWYLTCHKLDMDLLSLKSKDLEEAKAEAIDRVDRFLNSLLADLDHIQSQSGDNQ